MGNEIAARIHVEFKVAGDDVVKQIKSIADAIKESGVAAGAMAKIIASENNRMAAEIRAAAIDRIAASKRERAEAITKTAVVQAEAAKEIAFEKARVTELKSINDKAIQQMIASRKKLDSAAPTDISGAAGGAALKGINGAIKSIADELKKISASALTVVASALIKIGSGIGNAAVNAIKNIAKAIVSIPLAPLKWLQNSFGDIGRIIAGMVGFQGLKALGRSIKDLTEQAGPMEAVRVQFQNFMQQASANVDGFTTSSKELIAEMQRMTGGALSVTSMLKSANLAFALIGNQVGKDLPQLMGIAQAAALSTGQSVEYMVESLARGIGRLSTRWIDNTGISIDATAEYRKYGQEIGKAASALTQAERIQAMLNAVMRDGGNILLKTGNVTVFLQTQMAQFTANLKNMRDGVISAFAPFATVALMAINNFTSQAVPKMEDWSEGFVRQFARIAPEISPALQDFVSMGVMTGDAAKQVAANTESAAQQMGRTASDWATNALTWGANTGSQFAIGIMNGFAAFISTAMNYISSVLSAWLSPGSPPKVAPDIDRWGAAAMGEWVKGMLDYPITSVFPQIKDELRKQLGGDVKDNLFQWGVDSIAEWAKGLATIDLEFLSQQIEFAMNDAKRLNDELTRSYKGQKSELFKMQVLNRDPAGIKAQLTKVKTTKRALDANEIELRQLEERRKLVQEQLELFRLLERAIKEQADRAEKEKKPKGGDESPIADTIGDGDLLALPLKGTGLLEEKIKGIQERLKEIFKDPLANIVKAFEDNAALIEGSFNNLKSTIERVLPIAREKFDEFITTMTTFGENVGTMFAPDIERFKEALVTASPKILQAIKDLKEFKELWQGIGLVVGIVLVTIGKMLIGFGTAVLNTLGSVGEGVSLLIGAHTKDWKQGMLDGFLGMAKVVLWPLTLIWEMIDNILLKPIGDVAPTLVMGIATGLNAVLETIENSGIGKILEGALNIDLSEIRTNFLAASNELVNSMTQGANGTAVELEIRSRNIPEGVAKSITDNAYLPKNAIEQMLIDLGQTEGMPTIDDLMSKFGAGIPTSIGKNVESEIPQLQDSMSRLITNGFSTTATDIEKVATSAFNMSPYSEQIVAQSEQLSADMVAGMVRGLEENSNLSITQIETLLSDMITASQEEVGAKSPARKFIELAKNIVLGLRDGIRSNTITATQAIDALMIAMITAVTNATTGFNTAGSNIVTAMAAEMVKLAWDKEAGFYHVGIIITESIKGGIQSRMEYLLQFIRDFAKKTIDEINKAYGIASPSKVFTDVGENMVQGLQNGMNSFLPSFAIAPILNPNGITAGQTGATVIVQVNAPIVGTMMVPNMLVGREMSKQISRDIGDMALLRRSPA